MVREPTKQASEANEPYVREIMNLKPYGFETRVFMTILSQLVTSQIIEALGLRFKDYRIVSDIRKPNVYGRRVPLTIKFLKLAIS